MADEPASLASLPNEIYQLIYSYLPIPDRLNARVTRRMEHAEREGRWRGRSLVVEMEVRCAWKSYRDRALNPVDGNAFKFYLLKEETDLACLERVFSNTQFDAVRVKFHQDREIYKRLLELVRDCDAPKIGLEFEDREGLLAEDEMYDRLLFDLCKEREEVVIKSYCTNYVIEEGWERVYKGIVDGSLSMKHLEIHGYPCKMVIEQMGLIYGIDAFRSENPAEFEVFNGEDESLFIIYHANMRITLPSGFSRNPEVLYFKIFHDLEEKEQEIAEKRADLDVIRIRVQPIREHI